MLKAFEDMRLEGLQSLKQTCIYNDCAVAYIIQEDIGDEERTAL